MLWNRRQFHYAASACSGSPSAFATFIVPHIGDLNLDRIHNDTLAKYRQARRADGVTAGTINKELSWIRRIQNLAARVWRHDNGMLWLVSPPLIEMARAGTKAVSADSNIDFPDRSVQLISKLPAPTTRGRQKKNSTDAWPAQPIGGKSHGRWQRR